MILTLQKSHIGYLISAVCICAMLGSPLAAQEWVKSMFQESSHDFGTVPRGADAAFEFKFSNKYQEDVHVAAVRSSCGCTVPRIKKADLKTYEESAIICEFNTKSFVGSKAAVVTVVFTKPFYGEMQLNVKGTIRSDIDTDPGTIEFGDIDRGATKETQVRITARNPNWEIKDVRSANQHLGVSLERSNLPGKVAYVMSVRLKDSAVVGEFDENIVLVTNDKDYNLVTIPVRGNIMPPLVLPSRIDLGTVKLTNNSKSFFIAKSKAPFEIKEIKCEDSRFTFKIPEGKKDKHVIPFEFAAGEQPGAFRQKITVITDLSEDGVSETFAVGNVAEKEAK
jgi:Protein of unknown function (DUF1573)